MRKHFTLIFIFSFYTLNILAQDERKIICNNFQPNESQNKYFNMLDVYEFTVEFLPHSRGWDGNVYILEETRDKRTVKLQFLEEGNQEIKVYYSDYDYSTYIAKVKNPYLKAGNDLINYGEIKTYEVVNPPMDPMIISWYVPEGLQILSGKGTYKINVTPTTTAPLSSYVNLMIGSWYVTYIGLTKNVLINVGVATTSFNVARIGNTNIFSVYEETEIPTISLSDKNDYLNYELVHSLTGSVVDKGKISHNDGNLDFNHISKGLYILRITNKAGSLTHKINIK